MIEYKIINHIGKLQGPLVFYTTNHQLEISCSDCKSLRVNRVHLYDFVDSVVVLKDIEPGVYKLDGILEDGTLIPFEPIVIANNVTDYKGALLVSLQAECVEKRIKELEDKVTILEEKVKSLSKLDDIYSHIDELNKAVEKLTLEVNEIAND